MMIMCAVVKDMERGRKLDTTLQNYMRYVKPAFEEFVLPVRCCRDLQRSIINWFWQTKKFADIILPRGADNAGARMCLRAR